MFGYTGDDLAVVLFFFGLGAALIWDAIKERERGWRKYSAYFAGSAFVLTGLFWQPIKISVPALAGKISAVATSFETWAFLALVAIAAFLLSGPLVRRSEESDPPTFIAGVKNSLPPAEAGPQKPALDWITPSEALERFEPGLTQR